MFQLKNLKRKKNPIKRFCMEIMRDNKSNADMNDFLHFVKNSSNNWLVSINKIKLVIIKRHKNS